MNDGTFVDLRTQLTRLLGTSPSSSLTSLVDELCKLPTPAVRVVDPHDLPRPVLGSLDDWTNRIVCWFKPLDVRDPEDYVQVKQLLVQSVAAALKSAVQASRICIEPNASAVRLSHVISWNNAVEDVAKRVRSVINNGR